MLSNQALFIEAKAVLIQLLNVINDLSLDDYIKKTESLSKSSIGEHTRHIIEMFQELYAGYDSGIVNYDSRKRNQKIQSEIDYAIDCIAVIISNLNKEDKPLEILTVYNQQEAKIQSNYIRELMYTIEHCIHHQAIIKIGLLSMGIQQEDSSFGLAKPTVMYRNIQ
jgi:uncharacterized damage-inducible protein DinB